MATKTGVKSRSKKNKADGWSASWEWATQQARALPIVHFALKQRNQVEHEVKRLADDILDTIQEAKFLSQKERLLKEARKNLTVVVKKVRHNPMVIQAQDLAKQQGRQLLSVLNIPTRKDLTKLNTRLRQIEQRLSQLPK